MFYKLQFVVLMTMSTLVGAQIPNLSWSTYHGGANEDSFRDMAIDALGNVYVVGSTRSTNAIATAGSYQPTIAGATDVYISKYDTDGNRIWATYFGGSADDVGQSIDLDASGNIFITGLTFSSNGIATVGTHQTNNNGNGDTFLAKFSNNGIKIWGSYLGGENFDFANDIEIDNAGNPIIIGWTNSINNISTIGSFQDTYSGQDDVLFAKFDTNGQLQWSSYFGGVGFDTGLQVESDGVGNIIISGWTSSMSNIATPSGIQTIYGGSTADVFLAVFDGNGNRIWATYYGGSGNDYSDALFVTAGGDIYLSGSTDSPNNIASPSAFQPNIAGGYDTFLARFSNTGTKYWSTYFGGNNHDTAYRLRLGSDAGLYVLGHTLSTDVMGTSGAFQINKSGGQDVFLSKFENDGSLLWSTYYGGDANDFGYGLVLNANDDIFINGNTEGSSNLSTIGVVQENYGGGLQDGFLTKFAPCEIPNLNFNNSGFTCSPVDYVFEFELVGQPPFTIYYNIDGVSQPPWTTNSLNFFPTVNANLWTEIIQIDSVKSGNCKGTINSVWGFVQVRDSIAATDPFIICDQATSTYTITVDLSGGAFGDFLTVGPNGGFINNSSDQFVSFPIPFDDPYFVQLTEAGTFFDCDTISFQGISGCVDPCPPLNVQVTFNGPTCEGSTLTFMTAGGTSYQWSGPNGYTSNVQNPIINNTTNQNAGTYTVTVTDGNGCTTSVSTIVIVTGQLNVIVSSNSPICEGDTLRLMSNGGINFVWNGPNGFASTAQNPIISSANLSSNGTYILTISDGSGCTGTRTVIAEIKEKPAAIITGDQEICEGEELTLQTTNLGVLLWSTNEVSPSIKVSPTVNTTYSLIVNLNGCKDTTSYPIIVKAKPILDINLTVANVALGESIQIIVSGADEYVWSPEVGLSCTDCPKPIVTPIETTRYCVEATRNGCVADTCVNITVLDDCFFVLPNIFSPNGDGLNDIWCSKAQDCIVSQILSIYDRWGNLLHTSNGPEVCWDGLFSGNKVGPQVVTYILTLSKRDSKVVKSSGSITLVR